MYPMMGAGKGIAMLLISLGVGYLVCAKADKEKGFLKQLGYWIGSIIIILSVLAMLTGLCHKICRAKYMPGMKSEAKCGMMMPMKHAKPMKSMRSMR